MKLAECCDLTLTVSTLRGLHKLLNTRLVLILLILTAFPLKLKHSRKVLLLHYSILGYLHMYCEAGQRNNCFIWPDWRAVLTNFFVQYTWQPHSEERRDRFGSCPTRRWGRREAGWGLDNGIFHHMNVTAKAPPPAQMPESPWVWSALCILVSNLCFQASCFAF